MSHGTFGAKVRKVQGNLGWQVTLVLKGLKMSMSKTDLLSIPCHPQCTPLQLLPISKWTHLLSFTPYHPASQHTLLILDPKQTLNVSASFHCHSEYPSPNHPFHLPISALSSYDLSAQCKSHHATFTLGTIQQLPDNFQWPGNSCVMGPDLFFLTSSHAACALALRPENSNHR